MLSRQLHRLWRRLGRKGTASVEFAVISTFLLLPLFAGSADLLEIISTRAQTNTALQSLYYFGLMNPSLAGNAGDIGDVLALINAHSLHQMAGGTPNGTTTYDCDNAGVVTANTTGSCATGTLQTFVAYKVTGSVMLTLPLSMFGFSNPFSLSAAGTIQIQ